MNRIGQFKHVTVWLVLLGFLCGMMGPSVSYAKVYREIDTEGDPGDGNEFVGGSGSGDSGEFPPPSTIVSVRDEIFFVTLVPLFINNGKIEFRIEFISMERGE
jgi:hypothetical protein